MNLSAAETAEYPEISPPLTGGVGEGAQSSSITPTLPLPRQGGGKYMVTPQQRLWGIENLINPLKHHILSISRKIYEDLERRWCCEL